MPIVASLADLRYNGEFYLSLLDIKNGIGQVALSKDRLLLGEDFDPSTAVDGRKECLGIELDEFLGRYHGCHNLAPPQEFRKRRRQLPNNDGTNECARRREQRQVGEQTCDPLDKMMISPLMSKVNPSHLAEFAHLRECSVVEAAPVARLKALSSFAIVSGILGNSC